MATLLLALAAPILWSFPIYFCGWHSVRGLQRLRQEEALSAVAFALAVLPLSVGGLLVMMAVGWLSQFYFHGSLSLETLADNAARPMVLRSLFVGLSAIAVPHLLLHEVASWTRKRMPLSSQLAIGVDA
jgi:hypothetical protein